MINIEGGSIKEYIYDTSEDFATIRLEFLSDGYNSHNLPFTEELIREYAETILGKFIVGKYDEQIADLQGHETDEVIVGYIPHTATVEFKETTNGLFACVDGVISKIYANDIIKLYENSNQRAVSVEVNCYYNEEQEMIGFKIYGVTLLGLHIKPSCTLAHSKIVKFSKECENYYKNNYINNQQKLLQNKNREDENKKMAKTNMEKQAFKFVLDCMSEHEGKGLVINEIKSDSIVYSLSENKYSVQAELEMDEKGNPIKAEINWDTKKQLLEEESQSEDKQDKTDSKQEVELEKETKKNEQQDEKLEQEVESKHSDELEQEDTEKTELEELHQEIQNKDSIIMEKDNELSELRKFKENVEKVQKDKIVLEALAEVKETLSKDSYEELELEGRNCNLSEIDGWKNKVKAIAYDNIIKQEVKFTEAEISTFGGETDESKSVIKTSSGLWDK